jgi:hypothetical protein
LYSSAAAALSTASHTAATSDTSPHATYTATGRDFPQESRCAPPPAQTQNMHRLTMFGCLLADWLDLFTDEVIVVRDTVTRIEYDPGSPIRAGDWAIYVPSWYTQTHTGDPCSAAMIFYENAHDAHDYGGVVLEDANGLYVEVNLEMTTETANPLITDTADSVLGSTYELCWVNTVFTLEPSHIPHIPHQVPPLCARRPKLQTTQRPPLPPRGAASCRPGGLQEATTLRWFWIRSTL